jgi:hypothetical protein
MLTQEYFGLQIWVWFVVIAVISYSLYQLYKNQLEKLTEKNKNKEKFNNEPKSSSKYIIKIFNFNTEWCGWSRKFQPEWVAFMEYVKNPNNNLTHVIAVDVKCDKDENKKICEEYHVPGYPYIVVEVNGSRSAYEGERTREALISFVSSI